MQVQTNENGIIACCTAHEDKNPSLSASYTVEIILVKCHAGCTFKEIVSSVGMDSSQFPIKHLPRNLLPNIDMRIKTSSMHLML